MKLYTYLYLIRLYKKDRMTVFNLKKVKPCLKFEPQIGISEDFIGEVIKVRFPLYSRFIRCMLHIVKMKFICKEVC